MIPLYGFLAGDTIGLLVLGLPSDTVGELADRLQQSARIRVRKKAQVRVMYRGRQLDPRMTLKQAGLEPLERFDVVDDV